MGKRSRDKGARGERFARTGPANGRWRGGRFVGKDGYVQVWSPGNPMCHSKNYAYEHRLVMAAHLGRTLLEGEVVHHKNRIRSDNRIENLELEDNQGHAHRHAIEDRASHCRRGHEFTAENTRTYARPGGLTYRRCVACERSAKARWARGRHGT